MNDKIEVFNYLEELKDLSVLVIGETIVDEYQYGYTLGKAGKFPIVAFQNERLETYQGGVLAIYNHLKDFCNVDYWTPDWTIIKKRYVQNGQKLFETYRKGEGSYFSKYYRHREINIKDYDLVIIADFGHGFITRELRDKIQDEAKYLALNTQFNAGNMGMNTINKYSKADYVCIDENELRLATSNQYDDIEDIVINRFNKSQIVSITLSKRGTMIYKDGNIMCIDALVDNPVDTVGAGDAYLAITSPLAYLGAPIEDIGHIGNVVGAIACGYPGNKEHITTEKLKKALIKYGEPYGG